MIKNVDVLICRFYGIFGIQIDKLHDNNSTLNLHSEETKNETKKKIPHSYIHTNKMFSMYVFFFPRAKNNY